MVSFQMQQKRKVRQLIDKVLCETQWIATENDHK